MDPRRKSRTFRFFSDGPGSDQAWLGLLCVEDRVGDPL
jgi:hypothetical protein